MKLRILTLALYIVLLPIGACAQLRIVVLSDPHVMSPKLLINDGEAWKRTLDSERKLLDYSQEVFCHLVQKFSEEKPDILLITGDLTKDGEMLSHNYVKEKLDVLRQVGVKTYVIPGNHDVGSNSNALFFDGVNTHPAETVNVREFADLYQYYGYSTTNRDTFSLSYICEPIPGLVLIGIDSHQGKLSTETLNWICHGAKQAQQEGKHVLAMMHHPLFPHINNAELFVETAAVDNYDYVCSRLIQAGIRVVFTGHFHTSDIAKEKSLDDKQEIYDVTTGSVLSYPCDYREIILNLDSASMSITTKHIDGLKDGFSEQAKSRLYKSIYNMAYNKAFSILHDKQKCAKLANIAAKSFVLHAEGNEGSKEHVNAVAEIRKAIKTFQQQNKDNFIVSMALSSLEPSIQSTLTDTSNYGDLERADTTDDLTLTISF